MKKSQAVKIILFILESNNYVEKSERLFGITK